MTGDPHADRINTSLEEFLALNARLIRRIANLRAAIETVRDGTAHGDPMRDFCEQMLATDDKDRKLGCGGDELPPVQGRSRSPRTTVSSSRTRGAPGIAIGRQANSAAPASVKRT